MKRRILILLFGSLATHAAAYFWGRNRGHLEGRCAQRAMDRKEVFYNPNTGCGYWM